MTKEQKIEAEQQDQMKFIYYEYFSSFWLNRILLPGFISDWLIDRCIKKAKRKFVRMKENIELCDFAGILEILNKNR